MTTTPSVHEALADLELQRKRVRQLRLPRRITIGTGVAFAVWIPCRLAVWGNPGTVGWVIAGVYFLVAAGITYFQSAVIDGWKERESKAEVVYNEAIDRWMPGALR